MRKPQRDLFQVGVKARLSYGARDYGRRFACENCLMEHVLDYMGMLLEHNERGYKCELCGASGEIWLYDLFLPTTKTMRLEDVRAENWMRAKGD